MLILDFPPEILEKILSCLSYDEVSHCRLVCQRFNEISKIVLNQGFFNVKKFSRHCRKSIKSQLPRRESKRIRHSLGGHYYISIETENCLNDLSFTFTRYINSNMCCFIPGKVLDEVSRVIRHINSDKSPISHPESHDITREMRDLSSMAREYFKEKIAPAFEKKLEEKYLTSLKHLRTSAPPSQTYNLCSVVKELSKKYASVMSELTSLKIKKTKELKKVGKRIADLEQFAADCKKKLGEAEKTIAEQRATIYCQDMKLVDQEMKIGKLAKLVEEMQEAGNVGTARKNSTTSTRRGRVGGRETAIVTRATKRKLRQNPSDKTSARGRKKSRRSLNS